MNYEKAAGSQDDVICPACLKNGCTFCKINKNLSERIARFTKKDTTPLKRTKNNRWTGWNDKRRAKVLGIKI